MQQTDTYQFNLIEGSDDVDWEVLNDNMEKVETQLEAVQASLRTLEESVQTAAGQNCLLRLAGPVVQTASDGTLTLDLGGADMSQYRALLVVAYLAGVYYSDLYINGTDTVQVGNNHSVTCSVRIWLTPASTSGISIESTSTQVGSTSPSFLGGATSACAWTGIKTLALSRTGSGSTCTVYGIRA